MRCCVDFPFEIYFLSSNIKEYELNINVDLMTFLIYIMCHLVSKRRILWFCDAALTICLDTIFQAQDSRGMTPKSVLMCWHSWLIRYISPKSALASQPEKVVYPDLAIKEDMIRDQRSEDLERSRDQRKLDQDVGIKKKNSWLDETWNIDGSNPGLDQCKIYFFVT